MAEPIPGVVRADRAPKVPRALCRLCCIAPLVHAMAACHHGQPPAQTARPSEPTANLFSYFTRNGEDGVHLAYSRDGITWLPLNGGRSVIQPTVVGVGEGWQEWDTKAALMRDPSILRGPNGVFHLVWTIAWTDHGIGVAHSRDLIHWSEQTRVPVMEHEPTALNAWAPTCSTTMPQNCS